MNPRLIMFDFDGTLADSFGCFLDVADAVADRYGFARLDRSDMQAVRALGARQIIQRQGVPLWKVPMIARHARTLMARDIDRVPLFAGIGTALAELAAGGARLAIVTSNSRDNVLRVMGPAPPLWLASWNVAPRCSARRVGCGGCSGAPAFRSRRPCSSVTRSAMPRRRARLAFRSAPSPGATPAPPRFAPRLPRTSSSGWRISPVCRTAASRPVWRWPAPDRSGRRPGPRSQT